MTYRTLFRSVAREFAWALPILAASQAVAGLQNWGSFTNLLEDTGLKPDSEWIAYSSESSTGYTNNITGVLYWTVPDFEPLPIGGFDIRNGQVVKSYFIKAFFDNPDEFVPYNANTENGTPGFSWEFYFDFDGDGSYGDAIIDYGWVPTILDRAEQLGQYAGGPLRISEFTTYGNANPGSFAFALDAMKLNRVAVTGTVAQVYIEPGLTVGQPLSLEMSLAPTGTWQDAATVIPDASSMTISCTATSPAAFFRLRGGH
jgi:hypothetical protein